jgi:hypothetical protein
MSEPDHGMVQVVMSAGMLARVDAWLKGSGLHLFPIPVTDDLPTYGITAAAIVGDGRG